MRFNPPPGWPTMPDGWEPKHGWAPNPEWPAAPAGWQFWTEVDPPRGTQPSTGVPSWQQPPPRRHSRNRILIAAAATVVVLGVVAVFAIVQLRGPSTTELPFAGLDAPEGIAVDESGTVFVADLGTRRVYKLPAGADTATELPFSGLRGPKDVAVNDDGDVFVIDGGQDADSGRKILRLDTGATAPTELPSAGLHTPTSIAVDGTGTLYVTDTESSMSTNRLLQLTPGTVRWTEIDHPGLEYPAFVAVSSTENLFATDSDRTVTMKAADSNSWTEIVSDDVGHGKVRTLLGLTTGAAGEVYVVGNTGDEGQNANALKGVILKVNSHKGSVTEIPFKDVGFLVDVAVDTAGSLYVTDETNHRVLKVDA